MASTRFTFTIDEELIEQARSLNIQISAAAREGVDRQVKAALAASDRAAYQREPETVDSFWDDVETWGAP